MDAMTPKSIKMTDPKNVNGRLYDQIDALLTQLETGEHITLKERVAALIAVGRLQLVFATLRKGDKADEPAAGSAVRKYAQAFSTNDTRRRKAPARRATAAAREPDPDYGESLADSGADDTDDDDAA